MRELAGSDNCPMLRVPAPTFDRKVTAEMKSSQYSKPQNPVGLRAEIEGVWRSWWSRRSRLPTRLPPPPPPHPISKNSTVKIAKPEIRLRFIKIPPFLVNLTVNVKKSLRFLLNFFLPTIGCLRIKPAWLATTGDNPQKWSKTSASGIGTIELSAPTPWCRTFVGCIFILQIPWQN